MKQKILNYLYRWITLFCGLIDVLTLNYFHMGRYDIIWILQIDGYFNPPKD